MICWGGGAPTRFCRKPLNLSARELWPLAATTSSATMPEPGGSRPWCNSEASVALGTGASGVAAGGSLGGSDLMGTVPSGPRSWRRACEGAARGSDMSGPIETLPGVASSPTEASMRTDAGRDGGMATNSKQELNDQTNGSPVCSTAQQQPQVVVKWKLEPRILCKTIRAEFMQLPTVNWQEAKIKRH